MLNIETLEQIQGIVKPDFHVHISGLVDSDLICDLLSTQSHQFISHDDIRVTEPAGSLKDYLRPWNYLKQLDLTISNLNLMISSCFENLIASNIRLAEMRHTVVNIAKSNNINLEDALIHLANIIEDKCLLTGIEAGLIVTLTRSDSLILDGTRMVEAIKNIGFHNRIVGLDLAGDENIPIDNEVERIFKKAKHELNLGITIHAGETGNVKNIYDAITKFEADRIGHGTAAAKSKQLMDIITDKNICIEVCPISNLLSGAHSNHRHHSAKVFYRHNVPFIICSDNPQIHCKTLNDDYLLVQSEILDISFLKLQYELSKKYTFIGRS